jgi:hypothetical protein
LPKKEQLTCRILEIKDSTYFVGQTMNGVHNDTVGENFPKKAKAKGVKEQNTFYMLGGVLGRGSFRAVVVVASMAAGGRNPP